MGVLDRFVDECSEYTRQEPLGTMREHHRERRTGKIYIYIEREIERERERDRKPLRSATRL